MSEAREQGRTGAGRLILMAGLALAGLAPGRGDEVDVGGGMRYRHVVRSAGPLSAHVLFVPLDGTNRRIAVSVGSAVKGKETVPEMAAAARGSGAGGIAAVNGDYFEYSKEPRFFGVLEGLCIIDGELVSGPAGSALCVDRDGRPAIRRFKARFELGWPGGTNTAFGLNCSTTDYESQARRADVVLFTPRFGRSTGTELGAREMLLGPPERGAWLPVRAGQTLTAVVARVSSDGDMEIPTNGMVLSVARRADSAMPLAASGDLVRVSVHLDGAGASAIACAVGGGPELLAGGRILPGPSAPEPQRAPRTAVGLSPGTLVLAVVDGRQPALSVGMDMRELAEFMQELGCTEALNLDGGGSSTFWLNGTVMNAPSDGRLRPVGNCLIVLGQAGPAASAP